MLHLEDAGRVLGDIVDPYDGVEGKKQCHDRRKAVTDFSCAKLLYQEQHRQYCHCHANDGACGSVKCSLSADMPCTTGCRDHATRCKRYITTVDRTRLS